MIFRIKHRRSIVVELTAEDIYRLTGEVPTTRVIVGNVRADADRGIIVEIIETAQVLDKEASE